MLAVQICADICSHIIADAGWAPTTDLASGFRRLEEHGVITRSTSEALGKAVGLRNVVAHGYSSIDWNLVHVASTLGEKDLCAFASEVSKWVLAAESGPP